MALSGPPRRDASNDRRAVAIVTNPEQPDAPPTREERIEEAARTLIAGHPQGSVRRIVLYLIAFALVVSPLPGLAVAPLALLALTDVLA